MRIRRNWPDLSKTAAALDVWQSKQEGLDQMCRDVQTNEDVDAWVAAERAALVLLLEAFADDTADRNSRDTIMFCMTAHDVRKMVEGWKQDTGQTNPEKS